LAPSTQTNRLKNMLRLLKTKQKTIQVKGRDIDVDIQAVRHV